ncbi:hypothetical protein KSC_061280 [Ktedonobacter sp. SOSP1-52]|uniref:mersacidin/lichenicidin family type 2 lantibiotic n=1 Tax=Ktedonobacter sp. SOSP1-52 TaxID=2778366 RepID=UPI0019164408|nr:mersacidin/lichenicidin family type 2 lantibiotic [Ktedonobacter sp. SOSP1-52]GHO67236.1 hypothetical protein KSC_061280 [Ktedonobacter sp. SOSP1-52]
MQYDMTRAWKDEEYRESLSQEQQAQLESPAGEVELDEAELELVNGTGDGGFGGGFGGGGKYDSKGYGFAGGIVGNSYYCGNFSIRPRTNLNLGENNRHGGLLGDLTSSQGGGLISVALTKNVNARNNRFDFSCSVSGGIAGTCIFGGN